MSSGNFLQSLSQVRRQLIELCEAERFTAADMLLTGSGCTPELYPGLWEYLARRCKGAGNGVLGHKIRASLWAAGIRSSDTALSEAEYYLGQKDTESATYIIESLFGPDPTDHCARSLLARAYLIETRNTPSRDRKRTQGDLAQRLNVGFDMKTPGDAATIIDLLRFSGSLDLANIRNEEAKSKFSENPMFLLRQARILEQKRDPAGAISIWCEITENLPQHRVEALFKIQQLYEQLSNDAEAAQVAGRLAATELTLPDRMRLAIATRQRRMIEALAVSASLNMGLDTALSHDAGIQLTDMLLENGDIGLVVWLRRHRVSVSEATKTVLEGIGFGNLGLRPLPDTIEEAVALRSPEFLLPISDILQRPPKPLGWPGRRTQPGKILLVNGTLGQGGAERQFVELVRSLIDSGMPPNTVNCGIFSLEADRGFDRFLPDLKALGVPVFDMDERNSRQGSPPEHIGAVVQALPYWLRQDVIGLWHLVRELGPDTIHGWQDRAGLAAGVVGDLANTERVIMSGRNMAPDSRQDSRLRELKCLYQDFVAHQNFQLTVNSRAGANDYARWIRCDPKSVQTLGNAIDFQVFNPEILTRKNETGLTIRIGGLFRMAANKRPMLWLDILAELRGSHEMNVQPVLRGTGPLDEDIRRRAKELGLDDLDFKTDLRAPDQIYGDLDMVLLTSRVEGLPNVLIEAQACGLPVAATDVGGSREAILVKGEGGGLLLDSDATAQEAAAKLADWLPDALKAKPARRISFAKRQFGGAAFADRARRLYMGDIS